MPIEIYISVLTACGCVVMLTVVVIVMAVWLRSRVEVMEKGVGQLKAEMTELIRDSRETVGAMRAATARLDKPLEDMEKMAHTARAWTDRADRLVEALGTIAEPSVFFMSRKVRMIGKVAGVVLQMLRNPKQ